MPPSSDPRLPPELNALMLPPQSPMVGPFFLGERIGSGSFATVFKGHHREMFETRLSEEAEQILPGVHDPEAVPDSYAVRYAGDGLPTLVAIKSVDRSRLDHRLAENLESEIRILRTLRHRNIVALWGTEKTEKSIHLLMEYCDLGDLSEFIKKKGLVGPRARGYIDQAGNPFEGKWGGLDENVARWFLGQLASALTFLRSHNLIHRDLKPQNLLLSTRPDYFEGSSAADSLSLPTLKLADFGFARLLPSMSLASTLCGSPLYMAPEILRHERYDAKADLWSVGIVLYETIVGRVPFRARNHVELLKRIESSKSGSVKWPDEQSVDSSGERPDGIGRTSSVDRIGADVKDLVIRLLAKDPAERMSFESFFSHPAVVGSEGFSGRLDDIIHVEDDEGQVPVPISANSKRRSAVSRGANSTSFAQEKTILSRGLAQLIPGPPRAEPGDAKIVLPDDGSDQGKESLSSIALSKPVPVVVSESGVHGGRGIPRSAPSSDPAFAYRPSSEDVIAAGEIPVFSSSLDAGQGGFRFNPQGRPTRGTSAAPTGFGALGALHRNVAAAMVPNSPPMLSDTNRTSVADTAPSQLGGGVVIRRGSQGSLGLCDAMSPIEPVKGVVSATSGIRRGSNGNVPKSGAPDIHEDAIAEPAGFVVNHGDDDLPPFRRLPSQVVSIPTVKAAGPHSFGGSHSPEGRSSRTSSHRPGSQPKFERDSGWLFGNKGHGYDVRHDPEEYVVISKPAVEVEWLADEVESFARSPRSQPSSMDRVVPYLTASPIKTMQQEGLPVITASRTDPTPPPPHNVAVRKGIDVGIGPSFLSQDEGHPIVVRVARVLDRGRALQRFADEYLATIDIADPLVVEVPLQLYLHALRILQKGVDTARVGFDTFRYAQSFAAAPTSYGTTPPSSTPPGRTSRLLHEGMRQSPNVAESPASSVKDIAGEVSRLADVLRMTRDAFTACLDGVEKCRRLMECCDPKMEDDAVHCLPIEKVIYEMVLELARAAAVMELSVAKNNPARGDVLLECETLYKRAICFLESLLDEADAEHAGELQPLWQKLGEAVTWTLSEDDRRMATEFLASLHMRIAALKIKMIP